MRVLEIGAGTGGTTTNLLSGLQSEFGERLYSKYSYTDISSGFFVGAKERFKDHPNIEFSVLDISKDPLEQGFEEESYDLILAANVGIPAFYLRFRVLIRSGYPRNCITARNPEEREEAAPPEGPIPPSRVGHS